MDNQEVTREQFYQAFARLLTRYMEREKITTSVLARKLKISFKTIHHMLKGKPFFSHQFLWIQEVAGITTLDVIKEAKHGKEKQKENNKKQEEKINLGDFI